MVDDSNGFLATLTKREISYSERKELYRALQNADYSMKRVYESRIIPIEFIEAAALYGYEDFRNGDGKLDEQKMKKLDWSELTLIGGEVFHREIVNPMTEKKS